MSSASVNMFSTSSFTVTWRVTSFSCAAICIGQTETSLATGHTKSAIEYWVSHLMSNSELKVRLSCVFVLLCGTLQRQTCQIEFHLESVDFNLFIGLNKYAGSDTGAVV